MGPTVDIDVVGTGLRVSLGIDDPESAWNVFRHGHGSCHERGIGPVFVGAARRASLFADVGAYVGWYSCLARRANPSLSVVVFEPDAANAQRAAQNLRRNPSSAELTHVRRAVGACEQRVWIAPREGRTMLNRIVKEATPEGFSVEQTTLDQWCAEHGTTPDLVKIDVEGAEALVLRGMRRTIEAVRPTIFLEVHPGELGTTDEELDSELQLLARNGYRIQVCDKDSGEITPLEDGHAPRAGNPVLICSTGSGTAGLTG